MSLPRDDIDVIQKAIRGHMSDVHVALPGKVLRYDGAANLADVQLQIKKAVWDDDGGREYEDAIVLPSVPVIFPRAGGYMVSLPIAVGDFVLVVFNDSAIGEWRTSGDVAEPWDGRRQSIGYPVAIPGFFPDKSPPGDAGARASGMVIGRENGEQQIRISSTEIQLGATATDFVALSTLVDTELTKIKAALTSATAAGGGASVLYGTPYVKASVAAVVTRAK